jgi:hypothetical protein
MMALSLVAPDGTFAVSKLPADAPLPSWAEGGPFVSITRTADELSIVCREEDVPVGVDSERGWRCLRVEGRLDFTLVGVMASLVGPLAGAGIPVFVVSTFDTDYLLVKAGDFDRAAAQLREAGHRVEP